MVKNNVNELEDILLEDNINYKKLARFINVNEPKWTAKKLYEEDGFWMTEALGSYSRMMCEKLKIEADDIQAGFGIVINDDGSIEKADVDTLIRILMVFKPLSDRIEVKEQELPRQERNGFTVVEWGGSKV